MQAATAEAHFVAGRYTEALSWAQRAVRSHPNYVLPNSIVAASAALSEQRAVAERAVTRLRQIQPQLRISDLNLIDLFPLRPPEDRARWIEGLRKAGLPE
jgi:Flp pilus assembly protein TadD